MEIYNVTIKKESSHTSVKVSAINEYEAIEYVIQKVLKNIVEDVVELSSEVETNYTLTTIDVDVEKFISENTIKLSNLFIKFDGKYYTVYYKRFGTYYKMGSRFDSHNNAVLFKSIIDKKHVVEQISKQISG